MVGISHVNIIMKNLLSGTALLTIVHKSRTHWCTCLHLWLKPQISVLMLRIRHQNIFLTSVYIYKHLYLNACSFSLYCVALTVINSDVFEYQLFIFEHPLHLFEISTLGDKVEFIMLFIPVISFLTTKIIIAENNH